MSNICAVLGEYVRPLTLVNNCIPAWHLSVALIDFEEIGISRSEVITQLSNKRYRCPSPLHTSSPTTIL